MRKTESKRHPAASLLWHAARKEKALLAGIAAAVAGAVVFSLLPPLLLEKLIDQIADGMSPSWMLAAGYFGLLALTGLTESLRESLLTVFGQKLTRTMRTQLCRKMSRLPVETLSKLEPGTVAARFVGDVDTLENLFTSGIISMFADACTIISIFAVLFSKNTGLALLLLALLPLIFLFTRAVQKRMLAAQLESRAAVARAGGLLPESIRCIRMIHVHQKEGYMRGKYDSCIQEGYDAVEKTNLYDAFYSPVILVVNALVVALVMALSAVSGPGSGNLFGMSVGTAVATVAYISQVFSPIENMGMEIQTIQSAIAGVQRIEAFLKLPERWETREEAGAAVKSAAMGAAACVELKDVTFGYDPEKPILRDKSFSVLPGEQVTLTGRTGAGKSTVLRLLLGEYRPQAGQVLICGQEAAALPDSCKRGLFGYVEQRFYMVPGTVLDQITLFDPAISEEQAKKAARLAGLEKTILGLEKGYHTPCTPSLFSQGQWQLLAVARAVAAEPPILLLDEITANLDAGTEKEVLEAIRRAADRRTVISISHRGACISRADLIPSKGD